MSSDTPQLHATILYNITIIFDTVVRQEWNVFVNMKNNKLNSVVILPLWHASLMRNRPLTREHAYVDAMKRENTVSM